MDIQNPYIIGMIHLPTTLHYADWQDLKQFLQKSKKDLHALEAGGIHAALIENDADSPCQVKGSADVVAPMTIVAYELSNITTIPLGIEVLLNDPKASLAIAKICGLSFIRTDYFVDRMTRKGYGEFDIDPKGIMEYKNQIKATDIKIFADVHVKYATMVDKTKTIATSVRQAIKAGADGVIVSGTSTREKPLLNDLKEAKIAAHGAVPVIVGSGFDKNNAKELLAYAGWAIVGSSIKTGGYVDPKKVAELMKKILKAKP